MDDETFTNLPGTKKTLSVLLSILVSIGLLVACAYGIDLKNIHSALFRAIPLWLFCAALCSVLVNVFLASGQWKILLDRLGMKLSFMENIFMKISLYPLRLVFPSKTGDLSRALYLNKQYDFPLSLGVSSTVFIMGVNTGVLLLIAFVAGFFAGTDTAWAGHIAGTGALLCLIAYWVARRWLLSNPKRENRGGIGKLKEKLEAIARLPFSSVVLVAAFGWVSLFVHIFTFYFITLSLDMNLPLSTLFIFTPLVFIAGNLPGTFMGIGTRETAVVVLLKGLAPAETLLAAGLLLTVIDKLLSVAIGVWAFPRFAALSLQGKDHDSSIGNHEKAK